LKAKFNKIRIELNGELQVRVDVYPDVADVALHKKHYVDKPDNPYALSLEEELSKEIDQERYDKWWKEVSKHKELNPCLCHFVKIDDKVTKDSLESFILNTFDTETLIDLDEALSKPSVDIRSVSCIMKGKNKMAAQKVALEDVVLYDRLTQTLSGFEAQL